MSDPEQPKRPQLKVVGTHLKQDKAAVYVTLTLADENGVLYDIESSSMYSSMRKKAQDRMLKENDLEYLVKGE